MGQVVHWWLIVTGGDREGAYGPYFTPDGATELVKRWGLTRGNFRYEQHPAGTTPKGGR